MQTMGQFSWKYADTKNRIALKILGSAYVPCPDGSVIYENCYQGYGTFGGYDIYELAADWNRSSLSADMLRKPEREDYPPSADGEKYYAGNLKRYEEKVRRLQAFINGESNTYMTAAYGDDWKRQIGIDIVHENKSKDPLKFPIKICRNRPASYDKIRPSTVDPKQGR